MFSSLKNFFEKSTSVDNNINNNLEILCGLMIEAANTDGNISNEEVKKISSSLINIFKENPVEVEKYLIVALENHDDSKSLHYYTSNINKNFSDDMKLSLIESLWEIILSDGKVHDFESNLIRRLAGLLYISDVESGYAKQKVLKNMKIS